MYDGSCCSSAAGNATIAADGSCCITGAMDICGVCGGFATAVDAVGTCCSGTIGEDGLCCASGAFDTCGICDGDDSSCNVAADVALAPPAGETADSVLADATKLQSFKDSYNAGLASALSVPTASIRVTSVMLQSRRRLLDQAQHRRRTEATMLLASFELAQDQVMGVSAHASPVTALQVFDLLSAASSAGGSGVLAGTTVSSVTVKAVCGNGACEEGERCDETCDTPSCKADCPYVVKVCPTPSWAGGGECSHHGRCIGASGACACFDKLGYVGAACDECAVGFSLDGATHTCVRQLSLMEPTTVGVVHLPTNKITVAMDTGVTQVSSGSTPATPITHTFSIVVVSVLVVLLLANGYFRKKQRWNIERQKVLPQLPKVQTQERARARLAIAFEERVAEQRKARKARQAAAASPEAACPPISQLHSPDEEQRRAAAREPTSTRLFARVQKRQSESIPSLAPTAVVAMVPARAYADSSPTDSAATAKAARKTEQPGMVQGAAGRKRASPVAVGASPTPTGPDQQSPKQGRVAAAAPNGAGGANLHGPSNDTSVQKVVELPATARPAIRTTTRTRPRRQHKPRQEEPENVTECRDMLHSTCQGGVMQSTPLKGATAPGSMEDAPPLAAAGSASPAPGSRVVRWGTSRLYRVSPAMVALEGGTHEVLAAPRPGAAVVGALLPGRDVVALGTCNSGEWLQVRTHSSLPCGDSAGGAEGWCLAGAAPDVFMLAGGMADAVWEELPVEGEAEGVYYYWHNGTGESAWEPPRWVREQDEASGEAFYRDVSTDEAQWELPEDFVGLLCWRENAGNMAELPIDTNRSPLARAHRLASPSPMKLMPSTPMPNALRHK
jgi:hypothetical protein